MNQYIGSIFAKVITIKTIVLIVFFYTNIFSLVIAQEAPIYSNYFYNPLSYNPAYAGSRGALSFLFLHRSQWTGFKGAPQTNNVVIHSPIPKFNLGAGISLIQDKAGPVSRSGISTDWAYQIEVTSKSKLSFGLKTGLNSYSATFNTLFANDQDDIMLDQQIDNHTLFNLGSGVYFNHERYYIGLSMPRMLNNNISKNKINGNGLCNERRAVFLSSGYLYKIHPGLIFQPTSLVRVTNGSPVSVDLSANFIFFEQISAGLFSRLDGSFGLMFHYWFNQQLRMGYSYEYATSAISRHNNGSHEFVISYDLIYNSSKIKSPRYF